MGTDPGMTHSRGINTAPLSGSDPDPDGPVCDVAVIGGGAAGLSGALTLARARRSVVVVDDGKPRNAAAAGVHNFLTQEGIGPQDLLRTGRADVERYGGLVLRAHVQSADREPDGFDLRLDDGRHVRARLLLVTTGLADELPAVAGLAQRWGRDVLHCPYCHGWEFRDQPLGVLASGPHAFFEAQLFRQWTDDVTVLLHTAAEPGEQERRQLAARGIELVRGEVRALEVKDDAVVGVRLADGSLRPLRALVVGPRLSARAGFLAGLGLGTVEHPKGIGELLDADASGRTTVDGVWAAGNVADPAAQVVQAMAAGIKAAIDINAVLINEEIEVAVRRSAPAA
jgi:thioredoxin reductase